MSLSSSDGSSSRFAAVAAVSPNDLPLPSGSSSSEYRSRSPSPESRDRRDSMDSNHSFSASHSNSHSQLPAIPTRVPLKVLGTRGLYLAAPTPFFRTRFTHYFPQRETQLAALIAVVLAVIVAAIWTTQTVHDKWMENIRNPTTTLTTVRLPTVPGVPGMLTLFHANFWFNQTAANSFNVSTASSLGTYIDPDTPEPTWIPPQPVPSNGYFYHDIWLSTQRISHDDSAPNQPEVENFKLDNYYCGRDLDLPLASYFLEFCIPENLNDVIYGRKPWPIVFQSSLDTVCIRSYSLLDDRAYVEVDAFIDNHTNIISYNEQRFEDPFMFASLIDLPTMKTLFDEGEIPDVVTSASFWSRPISLPYSHRNMINTALNKHVDVNGVEVWRASLEFGGSLPLSSKAIDKAWKSFLTNNPTVHAQLQADPNLQLDATKPNATRKLYQEVCLGATNFQIPVITESRTYGALSFLSDLGGFMSLLSVAFLILFPVAQSLILPRRFLFAQLYNIAKQICCDDTGDMSAIAEEDEEKEQEQQELKEKFEQQEEENKLEQLKQAREQRIRNKLAQQQQMEKQQQFYDNGEKRSESNNADADVDLRRLSRLNSQLGEFDATAVDVDGDRGKQRNHGSSFEMARMSLLDHQHADASSARL